MPTVQGKGFSADLSDPWAQRIVAVGLCSVGVAVALTIHKTGGLKLIVENAPKALAATKVIKG